MPRRDTGTNTTPHPDGERESIINDAEGTQFGLSMSISDPETSLQQLKDEQMKRFEKMMRGNPVDKDER